MKKVAIYLRKSRGVLDDLQKHEQQLISLCESYEYTYDVYKEIASSDTMERAELIRFLENIKSYKCVVIMALDRLSRNEYHQALITQIFKDNDIDIITPNRRYNFTNETDIITSDFEKLLARQEFRIIKGRLKTGKLHSFRQGNCITTPPFPYRYNSKTKSLDIVPEDYEKYRHIVKLAMDGLSPRLIAEKIGMKAITIRRMLCNKVHRGYVRYANEYVKGKHEPVITEKEFQEIEKYKNGRLKGTRKRAKHTFSLSGIVVCHTCGYIRSIKYREDRKVRESVSKCQYCADVGFITPVIHQEIRNRLELFIEDIEKGLDTFNVDEKKQELEMAIVNVDFEIVRLEKQLEKLKEMVLNDIISISEGKGKAQKIKNEIDNKIIVKKRLEFDVTRLDDIHVDKVTLNKVLQVLDLNITKEELNGLYKIIINKITVKDRNIIDVEWK
ncbi:MAG: recombinase family protein [Sarcina sp.]